jgi:hypothetical protein
MQNLRTENALLEAEEAIKYAVCRDSTEVAEAISQDVFEDLVDVITRLEIPNHLWEIVDFKTFFQLCYVVAPNIRSATIAFLQQTG